jgi:hypothetical protein
VLSLVAWVLARIFPSTEALPGLDRIDPRPFLRQFRREAPLLIQLALLASTIVFVLTPLVTVYWPLPAFLLPKSKVDQHAHRLATHRWFLLRQVMLMLKTIGGLPWGAHPEVRAKLAMPAYGVDPGTWRTQEAWRAP